MFNKHKYPIKILSHFGLSKAMPHLVLLTGVDKRSKIDVAVKFAKWILGKNGDSREGPHAYDFTYFLSNHCECSSCFHIENRSHPDFTYIESSPVKIEEARELRRKFSLAPFVAPMKSAVIVNGDALRHESANCFLKLFEEPKGNAFILLISPSRASVLPTIYSRAVEIRFSSHSIDLADLYSSKELDEKLGEIRVFENGFMHEKFFSAAKYSLKNKDDLITLLDIWVIRLKRNVFKADSIQTIWMIKKIFKIKELILNTNANPQLLLEEFLINLSS